MNCLPNPSAYASYESSPILHSKKSHLVRVAKKVNERALINQSLEKDFKLEQGDPTEFLKSNSQPELIITRDLHSRLSSVGTSKFQDQSKERLDLLSSSSIKRDYSRKKFTIKTTFKPVVENQLIISNTIKSIAKRLEENKKNMQLKLKSLKSEDRITHLQQLTCMTKFEKTKKQWEKIEVGLKKKVKKDDRQLLANKSREASTREQNRPLPWCTTLRQTQKSDKVEQLIPVGHRLSGLYIKEILNSNQTMHKKSASCPDLTIVGQSKLPLEIEAVKIPGSKLFVRRDLDEFVHDEVVVENYNKRVKKLWAG